MSFGSSVWQHIGWCCPPDENNYVQDEMDQSRSKVQLDCASPPFVLVCMRLLPYSNQSCHPGKGLSPALV